mgnify:CR=1 FL=1
MVITVSNQKGGVGKDHNISSAGGRIFDGR